MIERAKFTNDLTAALKRSPVVLIAGARQTGKTTLARQFLNEDSPNYFDLEDPVSLARLEEPITALGNLSGLVVIDEVQRRPDLFPILRVLVDRLDNKTRFLILGSASGDLLRQTSESLAGRITRITISGFSLSEINEEAASQLWNRGGFPLSFLAETENESNQWRESFMQTLLERDFPQWGINIPATALRRFWNMLAHYHGQIWNAAELARSLSLSEPTVRNYLDLFTDAFMVRQLQPFHSNIKKRQVKSPKIYIRDSGILHSLLSIKSETELFSHPKLGASWEGYALEQVLAAEEYDEIFFWATHQGAEIDLVLRRGSRLFGVEFKRADAPKNTRSIQTAEEDLGLEAIAVVYPGSKRYKIAERVFAVPAKSLAHPNGLFTHDEVRNS